MIIKSLLDTDLYKFTIQQFIWNLYPDVEVEYAFHNRDKSMKFTPRAFEVLVDEINEMGNLRLTADEYLYLQRNYSFFKSDYLSFLSAYKFDPTQVKINLVNDQLDIKIVGKWVDTVLWEVPLMALISQIYFEYCDIDWVDSPLEQEKNAYDKALKLGATHCSFTDFGTRRRRNIETQYNIIKAMKHTSQYFMGTSNPYFAKMFGMPAIGTMAHEVVCGISALESMNRPNKHAMELWTKVYGPDLKIFLPDTYGLDSFLKDFNYEKANTWHGVRHDSGCPFEFTDKIVNHYKSLHIDSSLKKIIFSDSLDVDKSVKISEYCKGRIECLFGIGTFFTNDFRKKDGTKSKPMNMVIKLVKCNGINVCKLSQNPEKAMGDPEAIRLMRHLHFGTTL